MSDEIILTLGVRVRKTINDTNDFQLDLEVQRILDDLTSANPKFIRQVQNIGTTAETFGEGDLTSKGLAFFKNLATANYVELGLIVNSTFYPFSKMTPGQIALVNLSSDDTAAKSNTAASDVEYFILER